MSFEAIRWAMNQPVRPALTKFCLVAMAECVNTESAEMVCWPSYSYLCGRTGMNTKTVEQAVYTLKQEGYILDTGRRAGGTGKVVVYLLNTAGFGGIAGPSSAPDANGTRPQNTTVIGGVGSSFDGPVIPQKTEANPPKNGEQSPQKVGETPPKTGVRSRKESGTGSRKGSGSAALPRPADVTEQTWSDWTALRAKKRAPVTETVLSGARSEAQKAGLPLDRFLAIWCLRGSQGLQADWLKPSERGSSGSHPSRHGGFRERDYTEGGTDGFPDA